jgi:hypothetical protein
MNSFFFIIRWPISAYQEKIYSQKKSSISIVAEIDHYRVKELATDWVPEYVVELVEDEVEYEADV